jgi:hypothetical protein
VQVLASQHLRANGTSTSQVGGARPPRSDAPPR